MSQLHEVLAVIADLQATAQKAQADTIAFFTKQTHRYDGAVKRLEMFDESRKNEEPQGYESVEVSATVDQDLDAFSKEAIRFLDALAQKETTNQQAMADIVLEDGTILIAKLPATLLLTLENWLDKWKTVYENIPVVEGGVVWDADKDKGDGVFRARDPIIRHKTEKVHLHKVMVEPTDKHPAQIKEWTEDRPIGRTVQAVWTGKVFPRRRQEMLRRIGELIEAVKKARMRANTAEVIKEEVGKEIFSYIHNGR
jgi:hypothetical protein